MELTLTKNHLTKTVQKHVTFDTVKKVNVCTENGKVYINNNPIVFKIIN